MWSCCGRRVARSALASFAGSKRVLADGFFRRGGASSAVFFENRTWAPKNDVALLAAVPKVQLVMQGNVPTLSK